MTKTTPEHNKALVLEAFDMLFNKRDYEAAARFWSESYIQHSAHIERGRDGLFDLIRSARLALCLAEGDYVMVHGRFTGNGRPAAWIAADVVRMEDGRLGRAAGRGHRGRVEKRETNVRRPVSSLNVDAEMLAPQNSTSDDFWRETVALVIGNWLVHAEPST